MEAKKPQEMDVAKEDVPEEEHTEPIADGYGISGVGVFPPARTRVLPPNSPPWPVFSGAGKGAPLLQYRIGSRRGMRGSVTASSTE